MARCAIFVSYMATRLQLPVLISKLLNGTFKIRLQNMMINGVAAMVLGSHEGFSYFPESLTLHNCSEHFHTCLVLLPLITAVPCMLCHSSCVRLVLWQPQGRPGGRDVPAEMWRARDGQRPAVGRKSQRWCFSGPPRVLREELERAGAAAASLGPHFGTD